MKKLILFITVCSLFVGIFNFGALASPSPIPDEEPEYYGRSALSALPNSEALLFAYDAISDGVGTLSDSINVYDGTHRLTQEELQTSLDAYRRDRADHFWLGNPYTISYTTESVTAFNPTYIFNKKEIPERIEELNAALDGIIAAIPSASGELEREVMIHDILASRISYVLGAENAHNAYGALVNGEAVCEGYAEALQIVLMRSGIQSFLAIGTSINPSSSTTEGHEWNYVRINGSYYHVDLTWNDQESYTYHAYMNVSDARISSDHALDETDFALPVCSGEAANYFEVYGGRITEFTPKSIADRLKASGMMASFFLSGTAAASDFKTYVGEHISEISSEAGITGAYSYSLSSLGCEVRITLDGYCLHPDAQYREPIAAKCDEAGRREHYYCPDCLRFYLDAEYTRLVTESALATSPTGHKYETPCSTLCTTCGAERKAPHPLTKTETSKDSHTRYCECGESRLTEAHTDANTDGKCDVCESHVETPIETAKNALAILGAIFSHLKIDQDSTTLLVGTLIAAAGVIVLLVIISRIFNRRR